MLSKCIWIVDTIKRRGRIQRRQLEAEWLRSNISEGVALNRRTLYNYRQRIQDLLNVNIAVDPHTFEYYIEGENVGQQTVADWLLNSQAVNEVLSSARDLSGRIQLENVPSARQNLSPILQAMRSNRCVRFDYHNYSRMRPTRGVVFQTFFLKIFKQRWYAVGRIAGERKIKTYALDRMTDLTETDQTFEIPGDFDADTYFEHAFGIVYSAERPRRIAIRMDHREAKYVRGLPLHHTQHEEIHDGFSVFYYNMAITNDLVSEILSQGPRWQVLEPADLRQTVAERLRAALDNYENNDK